MGRIAEALKKAESERQLTMGGGMAVAGPGVPVVEPPAPGLPPQEPGPAPRPVVLPSEGMSESLVAYYDASSMVAEQYRSLRTRLLSMNVSNNPHVLAVTSAVPKEGKSVTAANLALIMGEIQHMRTVLIDGDFRRGSLARLLNQQSTPGLADLLRGNAGLDDIVQPTVLGNVSFIAAGTMGDRSAAEILSSQAMAATFRRLQTQHQYVIVDTPPATTVTDVGVIGQICHSVVMVIRMNRTPGAVVRRAVRMLQVNNIPVAGCVLVGQNERNARYGYYYGYYPYSRYYNDYYSKERR